MTVELLEEIADRAGELAGACDLVLVTLYATLTQQSCIIGKPLCGKTRSLLIKAIIVAEFGPFTRRLPHQPMLN